jgi:acyl-CoA reductase-like NAD-dependent aldehyde dehydrogenase
VASVLARCRGAAREVFSLAGPSRETDRADFDRGAYFPPTIVCCDDPESELVREESFAPVLVVQTAASWEHALELLNRVAQGLVAAVFTESPQRQRSFLQHARAGILKLNCSTAGADVLLPFGGWKASGLGPPEHGDFDREFYTRPQALYLAGNVGLDLVEAAEAPYLSQGSQRAA